MHVLFLLKSQMNRDACCFCHLYDVPVYWSQNGDWVRIACPTTADKTAIERLTG